MRPVYSESLANIEEINIIVSNFQKKYFWQKNSLIKLNGIHENFDNFKTNPIELLKEQEFVINEQSFSSFFGLSNVSCSFFVKEESFIAWARYTLDNSGNKTYPLMVYNTSQMKKENILQQDNNIK